MTNRSLKILLSLCLLATTSIATADLTETLTAAMASETRSEA